MLPPISETSTMEGEGPPLLPRIPPNAQQVNFRDMSFTGLSFLDTLAEIASQSAPMKSSFVKKEPQRNRPRASSEPWLNSFISRQMQMVEAGEDNDEANTASPSNEEDEDEDDSAENETSSSATLPQMLEKYSSIYNKNGRIGIYTRAERNDMISRFHEKRKRRVWKKKIRYHCRKNLADSRVRVKGRFVKCGDTQANAQKAKSAAGDLISGSGVKTSSVKSSSSKDEDDKQAVKTKVKSEVDDKNDDGNVDVDEDDQFREMLDSTGDIKFTRKRMRRHSIAY